MALATHPLELHHLASIEDLLCTAGSLLDEVNSFAKHAHTGDVPATADELQLAVTFTTSYIELLGILGNVAAESQQAALSAWHEVRNG
jgi:hypothetical protein